MLPQPPGCQWLIISPGLNLSSLVIISVQSARSLPVCALSRQVDPESQGLSRQPRLKKVKLFKLLNFAFHLDISNNITEAVQINCFILSPLLFTVSRFVACHDLSKRKGFDQAKTSVQVAGLLLLSLTHGKPPLFYRFVI